MDEIQFGTDVAGDPDDVTVVVFGRTGGGPWRPLAPEPAPVVTVPELPPVTHRWKETIVSWDEVNGWMEEHLGGEFQLTPWQEQIMRESFERQVRAGRLVFASTADTLTDHVDRARQAR
jgi:hypothetical protein